MYIKVRILIGGEVISPQEVTAPVGVRYKGRRPQSSRGKIQREIGEKPNRDVSGLTKFSGSCFGI